MLFYFIRLANLLCGVALDAVPYNSSSSYFARTPPMNFGLVRAATIIVSPMVLFSRRSGTATFFQVHSDERKADIETGICLYLLERDRIGKCGICLCCRVSRLPLAAVLHLPARQTARLYVR